MLTSDDVPASLAQPCMAIWPMLANVALRTFYIVSLLT